MTVELICIGDELLIGQTINTNAAWIGAELSLMGSQVAYGNVIRDDENDIHKAIDEAMDRVDVVLMTGGLGPTKDDITKKVLCDYFDCHLIQNTTVLKHVKEFFDSRKKEMLDVNIAQADVPENCTVLHNPNGTAPGMWFERNGKILVSMPGVPYEMKDIMSAEVLPRLKDLFALDSLYYRTVLTQGIGESYIADRMEVIETNLTSEGIALAYLPAAGCVRLRLSSKATEENKRRIEYYINQISELFPKNVFGMDSENLFQVVGDLLSVQEKQVGTAESCTGGAIASAFTSVPGSSTYFKGSVVSYTKESKIQNLGVDEQTINDFGLVSKQVAEQMAINGKEILQVDYCISITGNAGPATNEGKEEVGIVWISIASSDRVLSKRFNFENDRSRNIKRAVLSAMNFLRCELMKINM